MKNCNLKQVATSLLLLAVLTLSTVGFKVHAQVTTNSGSGLAATYPTLNDAILALNAASITSPVVITLTANETAPAGGYSITAQGSAANPIIIEGSSTAVVVTASGAQVSGALNDGVFKLIGADFVTIRNFTMQENPANTTTAAGTNNMTEWGVALLYATTTDGAQNNTIQGNVISLNRTYQNTFGIYSNSTHSATAVSTTATANTANGGNSNLRIYGNNISNVNQGITVVGPTPAADQNQTLEIGGSAMNSNIISDYGSTGTFSSYANVSGSVNGILIRNTVNYTVSHNTITSSNGGTTAGTLRGVFIPSFSNAPVGTIMNSISNNIFSLRSGVAGGSLQGIIVESNTNNASSTMNINSNDFNNTTHTVAATGTVTLISNAVAVLALNISNNTFSNVTLNTTGSVTFIAHPYSMASGQTQTFSNNSIVGVFNKTGAGGTVNFTSSNSTTAAGSSSVYTNNNFSNATFTGATAVVVFNNTDGGAGSTKTITGNTVSNITGGTSALTGFNFSYWNGVSTFSNNTVNNITGAGAITGVNIGSATNNASSIVISGNTISNLTSITTGGSVIGLACANTSTGIVISNNTIFGLSTVGATSVSGLIVSNANATGTTVNKNKIYNLSGSNAGSSVSGILVSGGTLVNVYNNLIGDLRTPNANAANPLNGINVTGGTTVNVAYNTVHLNGSSTGALFGSSAIFASTTPTVNLNNNIFSNASSVTGSGLAVAYRRSSATLTTYGATSNRNDFVASTIYTDGTTPLVTLTEFQTLVAPRDANSINATPNFLSLDGSNANFLHINTGLPTPIESGAENIAGVTDDFENDIRQGNPGYAGTGTAPDIGADEFEFSIVVCSGANAGTISPTNATICQGATTTMTSTGATNEFGNSFQWKVSTVSGGPYMNVTGGSGATTMSYTTGSLAPGTYFFVLENTCSTGPVTGISNEFTLVVNGLPAVMVSPTSATLCTPSATPIALSASGASTYSWSPAGGLSATTGASVNALPTATTTYTVTGTDVNGCIGTANTTITVGPTPVISSVTATPAAVCSGSSSQLQANATIAYNQTASAYSFAGSTGTYTAVTGTNLTTATQDDSGIGNLPIGFTFPYNGNTFTVFGARTNGLIELGQTTAALTGFSLNALSTTANCIAPLWDDNNMTGGTITYTTTGTAPNRVLTVQWTGMHVGGSGSATNPTIDCQVKLYETTGVIELVYGNTSAALASTTASIGISGASGNYKSVTPLNPVNTSTVSSTAENTSISTAANFPSGTIYTFTPPVAPVLSYLWTPSTNLSSTTISNPVASNVTSPITYSVDVTSSIGCSASGNVSLTVNPLPTAPLGTNSAQCGAQVPTASVASTTGLPTPTFIWYDAPSAGTALQTSTSTTYTTAISTTTTFYVAEQNVATGCESPRTAVTVTVASADNIIATISSPTICIGSSVTLNVTNANPTPFQNYTYTWTNAQTGSGLTSASGAMQTVIPTQPGSYTYEVTGVDGSCNALASVNLTVNPFVVTLTPIDVTCNGYNNGSFSVASSSCGTPDVYSVNGGAFGPIPTNLAPGTYSVVAQNTLGFQAAAVNITITQPSTVINNPIGTNAAVCVTSPSAQINASATTNLQTAMTLVIPIDVLTQPTELSSSTAPASVAASPNPIATATMSALPAGATVTSATINYNNIVATGGSWQSDVRLGLVGAISQNYTSGIGTLNTAGTFNYTANIPAGSVNTAGGTITMHYFDFFNDNSAGSESTFPTGAGVASITINYTVPVPATISWWNSSTGGTQIGTGSPYETVGSSVLPNTNTPGIYTFYAQGEYLGCSGLSRTPVTVTVNPTSTSTTAITACGSYTWTNGTTYTASGSYTQTLTNSLGCDSIATLNLTINQPSSSTISVTACGSYTWAQNTTTYTTSGLYSVVLAGANAVGCDSTVFLNLTINQPTSSTVTATACSSYTWAENSVTYTTSGSYSVVLIGANTVGCDSTVTLNLTINQPTTGTDVQTACVSYTWIDGNTYTASNNTATFTIVGGAANGCDSIVTLDLTINQPTTGTDIQTACASYTWIDGNTYTASNNTATFTIVGGAANGCDSIVTLDLTILTPATGTDVQTACGSYTWIDGNTYTASNNSATFTIVGGAANGCDSIVTLNLTLNQPTSSSVTASACDSYTWAENGTTYTTSGNYVVTLTNAAGCDSTITLNLTINASPVATATDNGDATLTASAGSAYQWIDCATGTAVAGANAQTFAPTVNGLYAVVVTSGSCSDTSSCVVIDYIGISENGSASISVFPNPTSSDVTITMTSANATVAVVDAQGKLLQTVTLVNGEKVNLSSYETGVYFLRINTENGSLLERVVKQ